MLVLPPGAPWVVPNRIGYPAPRLALLVAKAEDAGIAVNVTSPESVEPTTEDCENADLVAEDDCVMSISF